MKIRKRISYWILAVLLPVLCIQSCANQETRNQRIDKHKPENPKKNSSNSASSDDNASGEEEHPWEETDSWEIEDWAQAYLDYVNTYEFSDSWTYSLIYVDEDEIPELVMDTGVEAGGCMILTWQEGILDVLQTLRLNFTYVEKGNLLCNSEGNMGYYYDNVFTIEDGKWVFIAGGTYEDGPDGPRFDENDNYIYDYYWMEQAVEQEEYEAELGKIYPEKKGKIPEIYYIKDELFSLLKTGHTMSANHRYELLVEDITWAKAGEACQEKGGYLATLTSWEEFERVQEQIISEEKTAVTFYVGADWERYQSYRWLEPEVKDGYSMLDHYNALFRDFWLEGEPSYTGLTESGEEVDEEYVALIYRSADGRCYLNDVPEDILAAAPSYEGKIGYICEYDE